MNKVRKIRKSSGQLADYEPKKFHVKTAFAVDGLMGVSQSEIEIGAAHSILEGTSSSQIQDALINSAKNLVTPEDPNYQIAAARLLNQKIRKEAHGSWEPLSLLQIIEKNKDIYDLATLYSAYDKEELEWFGKKINYKLDNDFVYGGLNQMQKSYLTKRDGKVQESSQEVFMLISLFAFNKYKNPQRKQLVLDTYKALSSFEISLPSPTMGQLRTKFNRYFSCNIIDSGDDKHTIANAAKSIYEVVASGAGLGISVTDLRELGADIDGGRLQHTGTLPIVKAFTKDTKAFTQPQRGGSSTMYKNFYSMEIEDWLVWGNNKGTEETRERDTDYCIVYNELFFERYKNNEDITLFYSNDVPRLSAYMGSKEEFEELYLYYEKAIPKRKQKKISAEKLFNLFLNERFLQARLYAAFAENLSGRSSFIVPIKTSNLCVKGDTKIDIMYDDVKATIDIKDVGEILKKYNIVKVLSSDVIKNEDEYKEITDFALMNVSSELLRITDETSGNFIECTEDHKIWTENRGYIEAGKLVEEDIIYIKG